VSRHKWTLRDNPTDPYGMLWVCENCGRSDGLSGLKGKKKPSHRLMQANKPSVRQKPDCHTTVVGKVMES